MKSAVGILTRLIRSKYLGVGSAHLIFVKAYKEIQMCSQGDSDLQLGWNFILPFPAWQRGLPRDSAPLTLWPQSLKVDSNCISYIAQRWDSPGPQPRPT